MNSQQILDLAAKCSGPFYVYSLGKLTDRCDSLRRLIPTDIQIFYSLKANSHPKIITAIRSSGLLADASSLGELKSALTAGYKADEIEFTGPGKTNAELEFAIDAGVTLVIESTQELERIEAIAHKRQLGVEVHVRLNPKLKRNQTGREVRNEFSQFGLDESEYPHFFRVLKELKHITVIGSHNHSQSQILSAESVLKNFSYAIECATQFAALLSTETGTKLKFINLGGGFGVPYSEEQSPLDLKSVAKGLASLVTELRSNDLLQKTKVRIELGRFIAAEAGAFVTHILYTKHCGEHRFAIADGGFAQGQILCGVGQLIRRNFPIRHLTKREPLILERVSIAGPSCYSADLLAQDVELPRLEPGDVICFENVGAYGLSFSPTGFLQQQQAHEFFI